MIDTFARKNMIKAEQKKNENIAEYIIHMFKSEDLVRTFEFDLNKINSYVITNIPTSVAEKKELILWYASLIETMQLEKIHASGHLEIVTNLLNDLLKLHSTLLDTESDYEKIVIKAKPYIQHQIKESNNVLNNPIQVCINAVYGFLLLKLDDKIINEDQQKMLDTFGDLLSYLSYKYKEEIAN